MNLVLCPGCGMGVPQPRGEGPWYCGHQPHNPSTTLQGWAIYKEPSDFPGKWVVRGWRVGQGCTHAQDIHARVFETLDGARACLPPGLHRMPRQEADDPVVFESWI